MIAGGYDPIEDTLKVNSVQKKWRSTFNGSALDPMQWDITSSGGASYAVANGSLSITTGTTLDAAVTLVSRDVFSIPFRALVGLNMSQRIAGQTVYVELVSVDPETRQPNEVHIACWRLDGTTASNGIYEVACNGSPRLMSAASSITSTAKGSSELTGSGLELELFADEAWFHARALDSSNARSASYCRTTQIPDPNRPYKLRLRVVNRQMLDSITAVAAHSDTSIKLTRAGHGLSTGDSVTVSNLAGLAGVSFPWTGTVTVLDSSNFTLNGTAGFTGSWINTGWTQFTRNVAPASSTTVQFLFASILDYAELMAEITAGRGQNVAAQALAVQITGGNVLSGIGAGSTGNCFSVARGYSANPATGTSGRTTDLLTTLVGALVNKPFSIPEGDWQYSAVLSATGDNLAKAAGAAGIRTYVTGIQLQNSSATGTDVQIKDGATVIWRGYLPGANNSAINIPLLTPLRGSAATALNLAIGSAASSIYVNLQGYQAP